MRDHLSPVEVLLCKGDPRPREFFVGRKRTRLMENAWAGAFCLNSDLLSCACVSCDEFGVPANVAVYVASPRLGASALVAPYKLPRGKSRKILPHAAVKN